MSETHTPRLLAFPSGDSDFRDDVERAQRHLNPVESDADCREHLLHELRRNYRSVEIVAQDALAQFEHDQSRVWYVYRDGRVRAFDERRERLYAALANARRTYDASRTAMADATAAAQAAGFDSSVEAAVGALDPVEAVRS
ncbi:MAG TPA: hypothetical protein VFV72_02740 [Candidatus Limnocylindrales bacterium]|nr:hypothetical protein [Candidatus Limnocylindrales bacterium]